jgi:hypothetical protein
MLPSIQKYHNNEKSKAKSICENVFFTFRTNSLERESYPQVSTQLAICSDEQQVYSCSLVITEIISTTRGIRLNIFSAFTPLFIIQLSRIYYVQLRGFTTGTAEGLSSTEPPSVSAQGQGNSNDDEVAAAARVSAAQRRWPRPHGGA